MADGHHLKTVKLQYLSNRLTDRREYGKMTILAQWTLLCHTIDYAYYFT